ncbi:NUDIX hydrolase [Agromyces aerolatus]|uniref:NUDIX hydrolase n=1 Tax=Agromyces sp. LY-1074 TaxID=3074080 RepID=UPI00285B1ECB|nr:MULTISPECIES: NUDIX hydrolase [unclassified Agromyces]MDR5701763.1 NUDIX hydrolase [Agromyces sp. LY-1074]MDR5708050.1 NUDIX hydrolase [Agromyces sp. LY-1358]
MPGPVLGDERAPVEVVSTELAFEGRVWDVRRDTFEYGDAQIVRDYVDHPGAVGVFAIDDDDRVFLIQQYRHPIGYRDWEIPAGLLDVDGEDALEAAKRELAEEADLVASDWAVLSEFWTSPGGSDESIRVYLARGLSATAEAFAREAEEADMQTAWVPLDDLVDAVLARRLANSPLIISALAAYAARARDWRTLGAADAPWPTRTPGRGVAR